MKLLLLIALLGLISCAGVGGYDPLAGANAGNAAMDAGNAAAAHQNNFFTPPPSGF